MRGYLRHTLLTIVVGLESIHATQAQIPTPDSLQLGAIVSHYRIEGGDVSVLADITGTSPASTKLSEDAGLATWKGSYAYIPFGLSYITINGYLKLSKANTYVFKLQNTDGAEFYIDQKKIISNDGLHEFSDKDGEVYLTEGFHPFQIRAFNGPKTKNREVSLAMANPDGTFEWVPSNMIYSPKKVSSKLQKITTIQIIKEEESDTTVATKLHPSYKLYDLEADNNFRPRVGGIDFLPDGKMVLSTWDKEGGVYLVGGILGESPKPVYKRIAWGLAEPLGVKVVDGKIFVLQKQELTQLIDLDGDEVIDEYRTICNAWGATGNFHEFAFGLVYKNGFFYATLATAI
ncbi:MAG TPA: PA14 domain-containing protein, partial [Cytophagaceae bacterium]